MTPTTLARKMPIQSKEESISSLKRTPRHMSAGASAFGSPVPPSRPSPRGAA